MNTTVPMSRPSATRPGAVRNALTMMRAARTSSTAATSDASCPTSSPDGPTHILTRKTDDDRFGLCAGIRVRVRVSAWLEMDIESGGAIGKCPRP